MRRRIMDKTNQLVVINGLPSYKTVSYIFPKEGVFIGRTNIGNKQVKVYSPDSTVWREVSI